MAYGSKVKSSGINTKRPSAKRSGDKASSVKKGKGNAMSATRGLHGGRRKSV